MSSYLNNLRKQQAKHNLRKPKKVGEPEIRHTSKAHVLPFQILIGDLKPFAVVMVLMTTVQWRF